MQVKLSVSLLKSLETVLFFLKKKSEKKNFLLLKKLEKNFLKQKIH